MSGPAGVAVGVRLPLATDQLPPAELLAIARAAEELGYTSLWFGDHVVLPRATASTYPHTSDGQRPFSADTPWVDPLLALGWVAGQIGPNMRIGTSVLILTLRNPVLLAKQLSSLSWLSQRGIALGVGTGWLREEYDAVGAKFEGRATTARLAIESIRQLVSRGGAEFTVRSHDTTVRKEQFTMLPRAAGPIEFLWGGVSPAAMRLVARACDGWIPAKQPLENLPHHLERLKRACDDAQRDFSELRLVAKPGPGPDPGSGAIDRDTLPCYRELGFSEVILELPYGPRDAGDAIEVLKRVAVRSGM
ncbi:LLM class flavin-dependent oxidoreductase [Rhodococcus sp. NPDC059968]|uniref:LLM class flavin-dependent oxidoreductase n=1 Tax=Rhodococcus sp. NPDC059968 TaxID=3347017 RepID=UPI003672E52D